MTGVVEILGGLGLLGPRRYRGPIALALAAYLVAVFPANVHVAVAGVDVDGQPGGIHAWLRLAFQPLFIWWVLASVPAASQLLRDESQGGAPREALTRPFGDLTVCSPMSPRTSKGLTWKL